MVRKSFFSRISNRISASAAETASRYQGERLPTPNPRSDIEGIVDRALLFPISLLPKKQKPVRVYRL
jgi:hypothetical protein